MGGGVRCGGRWDGWGGGEVWGKVGGQRGV